MSQTQLGVVLRHLNRLLGPPSLEAPTDRQLLDRFAARRDEGAFEELLRRHGPMILGVCRRLLAAEHDADDVFQATFLVLVHKAASIRRGASLGCWLYGVAYRLALKARAGAARRRAHERRVANMRATDTTGEPSWDEVRPVLDEELARLPERLRAPLVLCYLEGKTNAEAARELGRPAGSMSKLLARGREALRRRLTRRGVALASAALALLLAENAGAAVPAALGRVTLEAGLAAASGAGVFGVVSAQVAGLVQGGLRDMFLAKCKLVLALVFALGAFGAGAGVLTAPPPAETRPADDKPPPPKKPPGDEQSAAPPSKALLDQQGDPLPAGAVARLGTILLRHGHNALTVAFMPDGKSLVSAGSDHRVRRWDLATGREIGSFGQKTDVAQPFAATRWLHAVAVAPDGKTLATGDHNAGWNVSAIRLWDVASGAQLKVLQGHTNGVLCLAYSPDGKTLASASADGTIRLWDPATGAERQSLSGHEGEVRWVAFSHDGKRLASAGSDGTIRTWDADKGTALHTFKAHVGGADAVAFSPDGKWLVSGGDDKVVRLWDAETRKELRKLERGKPIRTVAFAPDGKLVACGGDWDALLWDPDSGREVRRLYGAANEMRSLAFSPDGKYLAAATFTHDTVYLWETATGKRLHDRPGHGGAALGQVAYSADGRTIDTVGGDGALRRWEALTGKPLRTIEAHQTCNRSAALSPDGKTVVAGHWDGAVRLLDVAGKEIRRWKAHDAWVTAVAYSPDGRAVASAGNNKGVALFDPATGKELRRFDTEGVSNRLIFSPDGKLLAVVVPGQVIQLWEVATGKRRELRLLPGGGIPTPNGGTASLVSANADAAAFSADSRLLATGDRDGIARVWDLATGDIVRPFTGHVGWIMAVAISPDGRTLAVGNWGGVRVWEIATGRERRRFEGHGGDVTALDFAPDGRTLASGGGDTTGLVWDLTGRLDNGKLRPAELSRQELELAWTDLRGGDPARAYSAKWTLAAAPGQALPLLRDALPKAAAVPTERIAALIAALDDDDFEKREKATDELAKMGEQAESALRKALEAKPSAEPRQRITSLLERLKPSAELAERVNQERALEVLEAMGTAEARALLEELTRGAPDAWLTREAKAARARVGK